MLQEAIIKQYTATFKGLTYRAVAEHTGIQLTRVFRIFNGAAMKLSEYETLYLKLQQDGGIGGRLSELALKAERQLSSKAIIEIASEIERRLKLAELTAVSTDISLVA